jgi:hypothetical protein
VPMATSIVATTSAANHSPRIAGPYADTRT